MKLRALLFLVLIVFNAKAQEINFLSENFNNISSWCQNGEKFINTEENYIAHNSEVAGNDTIFKELKDFYPEKGNTTWKISFCALFSTTTANNFQFVLIANQKNYDENFYGIGVQIGKNNTLNLIKYNGKKQETVFSLEEFFQQGIENIIEITRTFSGVWKINNEEVYDDKDNIYDAKFMFTALKFSKTNAKKFSFKVLKFSQELVERPKILQAQKSEIIINEIMADINPKPFALPEKKYIELFNTKDIDFNLKNYVLQVGDEEFVLEETILKQRSYLIICNDNSFETFSKILVSPCADKLTITGKYLALKNQNGEIIDSLTYSVSMYNDSDKKNGGYSMERIDYKNVCYQNNNWKASFDISGGTPGRENSVYAENPDNSSPEFINLSISNNYSCSLFFSEGIESGVFSLNGKETKEAVINGENIQLTFNQQLKYGENTLKFSVSDFCNNELTDYELKINYPKFQIEKVFPISKNQVIISFDCEISEVSNSSFILTENNQSPQTAQITSQKNMVLITFDKNFSDGENYTLKIQNVKNMFSDLLKPTEENFSFHIIKNQDIIINEILFYPKSGCARFVELYNKSDYEISLFQFNLNYYKNDTSNAKTCTIEDFKFLKPQEYLVLTADSLNIKENYNSGNYFIQLKNFPALDYKSGILSLKNSQNNTLDSVCYNQNMYGNFFSDISGISLERNSSEDFSSDSSNWKPCLESYGFATPGLKNSFSQDKEKDEDLSSMIIVENQLFRPEDEENPYTLKFNFEDFENVINISVYDERGIKKKTLTADYISGKHEEFFWNGLDEDSKRCKTGIYIVLIKIIQKNGKENIFKKVCVISSEGK